ncbi:MAG: zinc-dependent metalloprotease, partial [Bacteroidales bacterium]|nr:zinc-dependent metalloprotease [Bacteroidales bacterium]
MRRRQISLLLFLFTFTTLCANTGFIEINRIGKSTYLNIPDSLLGKDLLFGSRIIDISAPSAKVYSAGQMRTPPALVRFIRNNGMLVMVKVDNFPEVDKDDPISEPLARNTTIGGICTFEIEPKSPTGISTIDVTKFFSEEVPLVWPLPDNVKKGRLEPKLSGIISAKNYDDHVNVRGHYEFSGPKETFAITVQFFLLRLPEETIKPRFNDDRIGYQPYNRKSFRSGKEITTNKYITRWRVEPHRDSLDYFKKGIPVTPQKQIVVYVEPYFPAAWIPHIKLGIEDWNKAFEKIGFRNTLVARELTDTTSVDPYDIKTNVVRYLPLEEANAAGQIWVDPRSGEIINGEVLWWNDVVNLMKMWRFTQTAAADPEARALEYSPEMMGEMIRYAIAHEIGHMLGIQHNMRGSYAYPVDSLKSATFTAKYGTTASIMDYARNNHVADADDFKRGVRMTPPLLGPFDYLSVEYGYRYFNQESTPTREYKWLDSLLTNKGKSPEFKFASFAAVPVSPDPSAQSESLGDDVVSSSGYGIENTRTILSNLVRWTIEAGGNRDVVMERYDALAKQYFRYITLSLSYLGGTYQNLLPEGDTSQIYTAIDSIKQKETAIFALQNLTEAPGYLDLKSIKDVYGPLSENIMKRQVDLLETMTGNFVLPRIALCQSQDLDALTVAEYLEMIGNHIVKHSNSRDPYIRNLQAAYMQIMKKLSSLNTKGEVSVSGTQTVIASAAYNQLLKTKKYLSSRIGKGEESDHYRFLLSI